MTAMHKYLPHYTYEDYAQWEGQWEIIEGVPYAMAPAPEMYHQDLNLGIAMELRLAMHNCPKCRVFMPIDWKVAEDTVLHPDVLVVCKPYEMGKYLSKTPSIIFEILSRSTAEKDKHVKYEIYEREGVKYYIIVNPMKHKADIFLLENGKYKLVTEISEDSFTFEVEDCRIVLDFGKVW